MKKSSIFILAFTLMFTVSCKKEKKETEQTAEPVITEQQEEIPTPPTSRKIKVTLEQKNDSKVSGNVVFTEENGVISMVALLEGLTPGDHAIHIHEKADCSSADGKSAGGHWNPTAQPHGKWGNPEGFHKGDIGNLIANDKGYATLNITTDEWCIGCGDTNKDIIGKAIIVHAGTDDFTTQPTGAAGGRVSCGGIIE